MDGSPDADRSGSLIRLVRLARQLEMEGHYNAAKLFWAAAFSHEIRASGEGGLTIEREMLPRQMEEAILDLDAAGAGSDLIVALEHARRAVQAGEGIPFAAVPQVHVCRACGEILIGPAPARCPACGGFELTFREFPPVHYFELLPPNVALEALAAAPAALDTLLEGTPDARLLQPPAPGEWSIREVLVHMLGAQELVAARVALMLDQENPLLKSVSIPKAGDDRSARQALGAYRESRLAMVARLSAIAPGDWWRTGQHEEFGTVTLLQQASYFARHDHAHLTQIGAALDAISAG